MKKLLLYLIVACCFFVKASAQDDLLGDLVKADAAKIKPAVAAVKSETAVAKTEVGGVVADVKSAFGPATGSK